MTSFNAVTYILSVLIMNVIPDYKSLGGLRSHHPTKDIVTNNAAEFHLDRTTTQCTLEVETYQVMKVAERNAGAFGEERDEYGICNTKFMESK